MIKLEDEIEILRKRELALKGDSDVIEVVCFEGSAVSVANRLEQLLLIVLKHVSDASKNQNDEELFDQIAQNLPAWFPTKLRQKFGDEWEIADWLFWFLSSHEERRWRWHGIGNFRSNGFDVLVGSEDRPFAWEALRVGIICSGAENAIL